MTSLYKYNDPYTNTKITYKEILDKKQPQNVVWRSFFEIPQEEDLLSFMVTFQFPKLESLRNSLKASGLYTDAQIEEVLAGLKDLPQYRD